MPYVHKVVSVLTGCLFLLSASVYGQTTPNLSVTNYEFVSEQRWSQTESYVTYRADLVNTGPARAALTATVSSAAPSVQTVAGQRNLHFPPVPAGGRVASSNTFTILVNRTVPFDFSMLQWSFVAPYANAGPDQTVAVGATVTVNGSGSTNPSGVGALSYRWAFVSRPPGTARLEGFDSVIAHFVADAPGTYVLSLTVSNGVESDTAFLNVSTGNSAPVADAGPNQTVGLGATAHLNGGRSSDADGDSLTYSWTLIARPTGSSAVLTGANTVTPSFVVDKPGTYIARLVVNDGKVSSAAATVQITTGNTPPVANAGANRVVNVGALVQLNGAGSTDVDGDALTYKWSFNDLPSGSGATLTNPADAKPSFTVDRAGTYVVQLIVNDGEADSTPATVTITTNAIQPPVADAGSNQTVQHGELVGLNGTATDPQGLPLTLKWSLTKPAGSTAELSNATNARPTFVADLPGTYVAQLIADNGFVRSAASTVTITTTNIPPEANPGVDQGVGVGAIVTLDGRNSADADHDPISYAWSLLKRPDGSTAVLSGASSATPTFVADVAGTYIAQLIVSDPFTHSDPKTVTISAGLHTIVLTPNPLNLATNSSGKLIVTLGEPAGAGGLYVNLASSDAGIASLTSTLRIAEGFTSATVNVNSYASGSALILASAPGLSPGSTTVNVSSAGITIGVDSNTVGLSGTVHGTITLSNPAPAAGTVVSLSATPSGIIDIPNTVTIPAGTMTAPFTATGLALGTASITANSPGYTSGSTTLAVANMGAIKLPVNVTVGPNQSAAFPITLLTPAPVGGVTVILANGDPSTVQIQQTVFIPQGKTQPAAQPSVNGLKFGSAKITATAPGFQGDAQTVTVTARLSFSPTTVTLGVGGSANLTLNLSAPAPSGLTVALSSDNTGVAVVPASVPFPTGATNVVVKVTGVAPGSTIIHAKAPPFLADTTASAAVAQLGSIHLPSNLSVNLGETVPLPVALSIPAPAGGTTVTFTVSDASKATVFPLRVAIDAGKTTPTSQPQITGVAIGSLTVTATAPAYASDIQTVTITSALSFSTTSIGLAVGARQNVTVRVPSSPTTPVVVTLSADDPGVAWVPASLTIPVGYSGANFLVTGIGAGTTKIHATSPGLAAAEAVVNVDASGSIGLPSIASVPLGTKMPFPVMLPAPATAPVTVNLSSKDPSKVSISPGTVTIAAGQTTPPAQPEITGAGIGATDISASATGYSTSTRQIRVTATLTFSPSNANLVAGASQTVNVILSSKTLVPLTVALSSENPGVASVPNSVVILANQTTAGFKLTAGSIGSTAVHASILPFVPEATLGVGVGSTTTHISVPASSTVPLGQKVQFAVSLGSPAATPVTLTLSSADASIVSVSPSTVTIAAGATTPAAQPQITGVSPGTSTITASGSGFAPATGSVNVVAGLTFSPPAINVGEGASQIVSLQLPAITVNPVRATLSSDNAGIAKVPLTVTIPANTQKVDFTVDGIGRGTTAIHATGPLNVTAATAAVNVGGDIILPSNMSVEPGQQRYFPIKLAKAAGPNAVYIQLVSSDTSKLTIPQPTVIIQPGQTEPTSQPPINGIAFGAVTVTATAVNMSPASVIVKVGATLTFGPAVLSLAPGSNQSVTLSLSSITQANLPITLSSGDPTIAMVPAAVTIPAGQASVTIQVKALGTGQTTIRATPGVSTVSEATLTVTVGKPGVISLPSGITENIGDSIPFPVSLALPAGIDGVTVTLNASNANISFVPLTCFGTPCAPVPPGATHTTVFIPSGQRTPASQPEIRAVNPGPVEITATAPGFDIAKTTMQVTASFVFSPTTLNMTGPGTQHIRLALSGAAPPPPTGLTVALSSSNPSVAAPNASSMIFFWDGSTATTLNIAITAHSNGTAIIRASSPNMADATATITVGSSLAITTESLPPGAVNAAYSAPLTVTGGTPPYTWSATGLPPGLTINSSTGVISGTPSAASTSTVIVTVKDATTPNQLVATRNFGLNIVGPISIATSSLKNGVVGAAYNEVLSALGGVTPYTWSATGLPAGLALDVSKGVISGTPTVAGTSTVAITVTDSTTPARLAATRSLSLVITGPPTITNTSLPDGIVSTSYSVTIAASGGTPPYTWSAAGLPAGLTMNASTGVISGTPKATGTSAVAITVTDSTGPGHLTATKNLNLRILAGIAIATPSLPDGVVGSAYSATVTATGGNTPYTWSATGLPAGLALNVSSGVISGTPTAGGTSTIVLTVTDSTAPTHLSVSKSLSLLIQARPNITTPSLPDGSTGASYSATVAATGGTTPYKWSAAGLPAGLTMNSSTGVISGTPTTTSSSTVTITLTDSTSPTNLTATKTLSLVVVAPLSIGTTSLPDGVVGSPYNSTVSAIGGKAPYTWSATGLPAGLGINSSTGIITGTPSAAANATVALTVTDSSSPTKLVATRNLTLNIAGSLTITTSSLQDGVVGAGYNFTLSAAGGKSPYTWSATGLPTGLVVNASTGVISGTPTAAGSSSVVITVTDSTTPTHVVTNKTLSLKVLTPVSITTPSPLPRGAVNSPYSTSVSATGGTPPYTWTATGLPAGLSINASTGVISGTATTGTTNTVVVTATDSTAPAHLVGTKNLSLTIAGALTITTPSLPAGVTGKAYTATVAATGGTTPYTWAATGLPAGLSINSSTGVISGTPSTAASSTVKITVTDSLAPTHLTATANLTLTIVVPVSITTASLQSGVAGTAYSFKVAASGGSLPYTWTATGLPTGLNIDAATGVISGTPSSAGTQTVALTVTDSTGPTHLTATKSLPLVVLTPFTIMTNSPLPAAIAGKLYTATVAATGGTGPYTWNATGLPPGLLMNASTGVISGTPTTAGPSTIFVTATDSTTPTHLTATKNLTLSVVPPLSITTASLDSGVAGKAYSFAAVATGGTSPYTWTATGLPAGLSINASTGVISGTPGAASTSTVVLTVKDSTISTPITATKSLPLVIKGPLAITTNSPLPAGTTGTAYSATVAATGGTAPYTWKATGLPAGLSINISTGVISGTTTTTGTSTVVVTATDSMSPTPLTATKNFTLSVVPPLSISTTSLKTGVKGMAYTFTPAAGGGTTPYTWSATGLPAGLAIAPSTGAITGTPTSAGTSTVTLKVTDATTPNLSTTKNLSLVVVESVTISTTSLPAGSKNAPYSFTVTAAGGTTPYSWSATGLPSGLSINAATGQISGVPTVQTVSPAAVKVTVTDSTNPHLTATKDFSLTIGAAVPAVILVNGGDGQSTAVGTPFPQQLQVKVTDASNQPIDRYPVTFVAPSSGPSLTFATAGSTIIVNTNAAGIALTPPMTANMAAGIYNVAASVSGLPGVNFRLANTGVSAPLSISGATVGQNLQTLVTVSISTPAGAGGLPVLLSSGDSSRLLLGGLGKGSLQVTIPEGQTQISVLVQGLAKTGSVTVTATATGYATATANIGLTPSGFVLAGPNDIGVSFQTYQSLITNLTVYSARLDATGKYVEKQQIRSSLGGALSVAVTSTSAGMIQTSPLAFNPGDSSAATTFKAISTGTATITAGTPANFTPVTGGGNTVVATILAPGTVCPTGIIVGRNLQTIMRCTLNGAVTTAGATFTITSGDATRLRFSTTPNGAGTGSITLGLPVGAHGTTDFYVQAFDNTGNVNFTAQASGFGSTTGSVALAPSGIVFTTPSGGVANPILAALGGSPKPVTVYSARLNSAGAWAETQAVAGGVSATATITAANPAVGTVNPAQVSIGGGQASATTQFQPASVGTTSLSVSVPVSPAGFSTPSAQYKSIDARVTQSAIVLGVDSVSIGKDLQVENSVVLSQAAPSGGLVVTITSNSLSLLVSNTPTATGANSIGVTVPGGTTSAKFYLQALGASGTASYKASASGYLDGNGTATLTKSGVVVSSTADVPFVTITAGTYGQVKVNMAQLNPADDSYASTQQLRGGLSLDVTVGSGNNGILTVNTPVKISGGADPAGIVTTIHGVAAGTTSISVVQPPGYTAATNSVFAFKPMPSINVTVN